MGLRLIIEVNVDPPLARRTEPAPGSTKAAGSALGAGRDRPGRHAVAAELAADRIGPPHRDVEIGEPPRHQVGAAAVRAGIADHPDAAAPLAMEPSDLAHDRA